MTRPARPLGWDAGVITAVDQTVPSYRVLRLSTVDDVVDAIGRRAISGASTIGVAGALAVAVSARAHTSGGRCDAPAVRADARRITRTQPSAWAVRRVLAEVDGGPDAVLDQALGLLVADGLVNRAAAARAADLVLRVCPRRPLRLLTHCNAETALGAIGFLADAGHVGEVLVGEGRPLTTSELAGAGIPHRSCARVAGSAEVAAGLVDCVLVGADLVCANGDVANRTGTFALALAARRARVPFVVVAPESTVDRGVVDGVPAAFIPAFDLTPADLVTAVVTENRVCRAEGWKGKEEPWHSTFSRASAA